MIVQPVSIGTVTVKVLQYSLKGIILGRAKIIQNHLYFEQIKDHNIMVYIILDHIINYLLTYSGELKECE